MFVRRNSTFDAVFVSVMRRLGNKRKDFGTKRKKKLIAATYGLVGMKGYLEIYNRMRPLSRQTFEAFFGR